MCVCGGGGFQHQSSCSVGGSADGSGSQLSVMSSVFLYSRHRNGDVGAAPPQQTFISTVQKEPCSHFNEVTPTFLTLVPLSAASSLQLQTSRPPPPLDTPPPCAAAAGSSPAATACSDNEPPQSWSRCPTAAADVVLPPLCSSTRLQ